jgi:hypothetical protein
MIRIQKKSLRLLITTGSLWLFGIFSMPSASADMSLKNFVRLYEGSEIEQTMLESYISGVGNGFFWANARLSMMGQAPLFCTDEVYSSQQMLKLAAEATKAYLKKHSLEEKMVIEMLLLFKFQTLHPCKAP